jgi:hypothetical protein
MEEATSSSDGILEQGMERFALHLEVFSLCGGGVSVGVSPWKIFHMFSLPSPLKTSIYYATVWLK